MKNRYGYVSNSSSSSFIIADPIEELRKLRLEKLKNIDNIVENNTVIDVHEQVYDSKEDSKEDSKKD